MLEINMLNKHKKVFNAEYDDSHGTTVEAKRGQLAVREVRNKSHIKPAISNNQLDEVVIQTRGGKAFVLYADELKVSKGRFPQKGDQIYVANLDLEGYVLEADDEKETSKSDQSMNKIGGIGAITLGSGSIIGSNVFAKVMAHGHQLPIKNGMSLAIATGVALITGGAFALSRAKTPEVNDSSLKQFSTITPASQALQLKIS